jgi:hypothetical protein
LHERIRAEFDQEEQAMSELEFFEITEYHATFRPSGEVSLAEAIQLVNDAIAHARDRGIRKLMVNITELTGFESPPIGSRYFLVREWAQTARGAVSVAMVLRDDFIDPQKFGVTAAANAGLTGEAFTTEEEAVEWLLNLE